MRPNSLMHLSISASAIGGSAGEPGSATAPSMSAAASAAALGVTTVDHDARALLGEKCGDRTTDAAGSADHDGATAGQRCANRLSLTGFIMSMFQ